MNANVLIFFGTVVAFLLAGPIAAVIVLLTLILTKKLMSSPRKK